MDDIAPNTSENFTKVGGLHKQIQTIKDLILFPLRYKAMSSELSMRMPRGCIFHGPPGTGKTLVASLLAAECSTVGGRKVTFIARKGADILDCYVGESEKRLRQVFARARLFAPAIIFFDELDALAPARSSLGRGNQVHASLVSVLLTEMDGVCGDGGDDDVFVIGATNRLETVDPALRRPGRFDRELLFALPNESERREIIRVHVSRWRPVVSDETVAHLAAATHGHCGADLAAICTEALMCCLRRTQPPEGATRVKVSREDFAQACDELVPAAYRSATVHARSMPAYIEPLFRGQVDAVVDNVRRKYPHGFLRGGNAVGPARSVPRVLLTDDADLGHTLHLAPAVLHRLEHLPVVALDVEAVCGAQCTPDMACADLLTRVRSSLPCVLYAPDLTSWWALVSETTRLMILSFVRGLAANTALLIVATVREAYADVPTELQRLFADKSDVCRVQAPRDVQRRDFFSPLFLGDGQSDVDGDEDAQTDTDSDRDAGGSSSGSRASATRRASLRSVRSGRVAKATVRKLASHDSPPPGKRSPRLELLQRLVTATRGWPVLRLEHTYAALESCCGRWPHRQDEQRLLAELEACVASVEARGQEQVDDRQEDRPDFVS